MVLRREPDAVRVPIAPRERLDRARGVAFVVVRVLVIVVLTLDSGPQDGPIANPGMVGRGERGNDGARRVGHPKRGVAARNMPTARVERVATECDVLARDVLL